MVAPTSPLSTSGGFFGDDSDEGMTMQGGPTATAVAKAVASAAASGNGSHLRRKRSNASSSSRTGSGGGLDKSAPAAVAASSGTSGEKQQQQKQHTSASETVTAPFFTPDAARIGRKNAAADHGSDGQMSTGVRTARTVTDMTPSPLPSMAAHEPNVSPVPRGSPTDVSSGSTGRSRARSHRPPSDDFDDEDDLDGVTAHQRSRVLFQETEGDDTTLDTSDENFTYQHHHQQHQPQQQRRKHHHQYQNDYRDPSPRGRRTRSLPTIDDGSMGERTHPSSMESIGSTTTNNNHNNSGGLPSQYPQQSYHSSSDLPQDSSYGHHFANGGGRSSPTSRRRSSSRNNNRSLQHQQHFVSPNAVHSNGGARQRGLSSSRHHADRTRRAQSHGYLHQQAQFGNASVDFHQQQHLHHSNQTNNSSLLSMEEVGSSIERYSSSSNESSPERGYRGGHVRALSASSAAPAAAPFDPTVPGYPTTDALHTSYPPQHYPPHPHQQHILSHLPPPGGDSDGISSPSKDKETKQYQQALPFSFGGSANAPATLVQPGLGVSSSYDGRGGQMTHLGPMTPSIMSSRPMSPVTGGVGVGAASPRYGTSSFGGSAYPNLHRIRIRFRSLVSSTLLLASVMFMLILAANYGSISSLDFGYYSSTNRDEAATSQLEKQQQYDEYKPVPVATVGGGVSAVGLGLHENGGETLYGEVGEEGSTSSNFVIRRGAGGLRVASNIAPATTPPDHSDDRDEGSGGDDSEQNVEQTKDESNVASTAAGAAVVAAAADQSNKEKKRKKRGFPKLDSEFYASKNRHPIMHGGYPRLLNINHKVVDEPPPSREVELYPAEFSDNTQFYPVVDSTDDPRAERMEMRKPYEDEECAPMADWQTTYNPSCNGMHELDVENGYNEREGRDLLLFGTGGFWRNAWKLDLPDHNATAAAPAGSAETFVLKTLKYEHNFEDNFEEHDRIDAIALERLTSSRHVINIYGFCGHSVISEYADGPRLGTLADKSKKIPLKRLEIARDIATGLADVHGIDGDDQASFVHLDINPANVVVVGKTLKLNDFNIGIPLKKNKKTGKTCGFPAQYPNPQWRSPEESREQDDLTEKVDVFSLGHIFFRLICGHEPWNKLEPGGRPEKEEMLEKVKKGTLPFIPEEILKSEDQEIQIIRDAMLKCYTADPDERPSARAIASELQSAYKKLSDEKSHTTKTTSDKTKAKPTTTSVAKKTTSTTAKASTADKKETSSAEKMTATERKLKEVTGTTKKTSTKKDAKAKKKEKK